MDLRRRVHERNVDPRGLRRPDPGRHRRNHRGFLQLSRGRFRIPLLGRRGRPGQHGPLRPGAGHQVDQGQHPILRRRSQFADPFRRIGRGRLRQRPPPVAHQWPSGETGHHAERLRQRAVELHDGRDVQAHRRRSGQRRRLQRVTRRPRHPGRHGMHALRRSQKPVAHPVEFLLGHSGLPVGADHRRRLPAQTSKRHAQRGRLWRRRNSRRNQPRRR